MILCSEHICEFLQNRAKAIIYTTAPSIFDIALGYQGLLSVFTHKEQFKHEIAKRQEIIQTALGQTMKGLICSYPLAIGTDALVVQQKLLDEGFLVGAIRPPTVPSPILRIIPRLSESIHTLEALCESIAKVIL